MIPHLVITLLGLALLLAWTPSPAPAGWVLKRVLKQKTLRVGINPTFPPLEAVTKDGEIIGFDVDLAKTIARHMGVELKLVEMPFAKLLPTLAAGKLDMVISGLSITPQRNTKVVFVGPYMLGGQTILIKAANAERIRGPTDLDSPVITVAVTAHTTAEDAVKTHMPRAKIRSVDGEMNAFRLLVKGEAQAMVGDLPFNALMAFRHRDAGLIHLDTPFTFEPLGIAIPQGDPDLANWLSNLLTILKGSGKLDQMGDKWFRDPAWVDELR